MGKSNTEQLSFRGRNDDVALNSGTFTYALNANWTQTTGVAFRVRFEIEEDAGGTDNLQAQLEYNRNGAGWNVVNASSSVVRSTASGQFTNGDATTNVLTSSALSFVANEGESSDGICAQTTISNQHTEPEYCIQIIAADVNDADTIELRVTDNGSALEVYTQTPSLTVNKVTPSYVVQAVQRRVMSAILGR